MNTDYIVAMLLVGIMGAIYPRAGFLGIIAFGVGQTIRALS